MKDTIAKMRALVSIKSALLTSIQDDLDTANRRIVHLESRVEQLEEDASWWKSLDESMARVEIDERGDEIQVDTHISEYIQVGDIDTVGEIRAITDVADFDLDQT